MGDSIWKKEISLGRKRRAEPSAPPQAEAETSVWKKEISFRRKRAEAPPPVVESAPAQPKQSVLKKEISFRRKPKAEAPAPVPAEPKQSLLKKEISFGRKKSRDREIERLSEQAAQALSRAFAPLPPPSVETPPPTALAEAALAAAPEPAPVEPVAPVEAAPVEAVPVAAVPAEPRPVDAAPAAEVPVLPLDPAAAPAPVGGLSPEIVAASAEPPPAPVVEPAPVPAAPTQPLEQGPVEQWMEPAPQPEPWLAAPEVPPAPEPVPAPEAVVVHPPVPAAELPPLPAAGVPFWKRELSLGRRSGAPKAPKPPKPERPQAERVPFWKKELSLSRRSKPAAPAAAAPVARPTHGPFWKRGIALPSLSLPSVPSRGGHKVKKFVGLKIGGSQLAAARVSNNGVAELLQVAREPLEPGVVVSGELRDPDALAEALKRFFTRNKLPRRNVRLGIASNRIGVRIFDVAGIGDEKQLENAIHFRAQEALPIPLDEAVLDYHVVGEAVDEEGNATRRILLVVAYRELVDRYVSACRKAGITLAGIDLEAFALLRALSAPRPEGAPGDSALVAVAIGHDRSTFAVSDGRVCEFTRVLDWGGATLSVAIARALNLAPSEVEAIKRALSLESPEVPQGIAPDQYGLAVDAVRKQVQAFARELVSSLQFYQNQPGSLGIGEIAITGGTASLAGLAAELQRLIGVRVRVGDPLARLKVAKKVAPDVLVGSLAVAIGLGIED